MSMIFKFRMLNDEDDNFIRDYEVPYDMSLLDFHKFICQDLNYDDTNMTSFFTSNSRWERFAEFTLMDMGSESSIENELAPIPMSSVVLGQIIKKNHDRLIYVFDMLEERAMYLELMGAMRDDEKGYPRVALSNGVAPDQFDPEASVVNKSIFDEAMDDFSDFEGNETYDDEF